MRKLKIMILCCTMLTIIGLCGQASASDGSCGIEYGKVEYTKISVLPGIESMIITTCEYKIEYKFKHKGKIPSVFQTKTETYRHVWSPFYPFGESIEDNFKKWKETQIKEIKSSFDAEQKNCK